MFATVRHGRMDVVEWPHEINAFVSFESAEEAREAKKRFNDDIDASECGWTFDGGNIKDFCDKLRRCQ